MTRHQYGISAFVSQASFGGETSGSVAKCRLFSQGNELLQKNFRNIKDFALNFPKSSINLTDKYYISELRHSLVMSTLLSMRACYILRSSDQLTTMGEGRVLMEGNNTERFTMLENYASAQHLAISLEANRMKYREVNGMGQKTYATIKSM